MAYINGKENLLSYMDGKENIFGVRVDVGGENEKEPVAYLYNGVRLPAIPEYDKAAYPYSVITYSGTTNKNAILCVSDKSPTMDDNGKLVHANYSKYVKYYWANGSEEWADNGSGVTTTGTLWPGNSSFWTNTDILNADGSVYLEASEPVPVYE